MVKGIVQIPRPIPSIVLVAPLLISVVGVVAALPTTARTDDCITAPNSPHRGGATGTTGSIEQLTASAGMRAHPASRRNKWLRRRQRAVRPHLPHLSAPSSPQVKISTVKPIPAPVRGGKTDKTVQQSARKENTVPTPEVPTPQTNTLSETTSERGDKLAQFCRNIDRMLQSLASPDKEPLRGRQLQTS